MNSSFYIETLDLVVVDDKGDMQIGLFAKNTMGRPFHFGFKAMVFQKISNVGEPIGGLSALQNFLEPFFSFGHVRCKIV